MHSIRNATTFILAVYVLLAPVYALAEGKAYLRLINAAGGKPINGIAGDLTFKQVKEFSAYLPIDTGEYEASVHKTKLSVELTAPHRYSLVYYKKDKKKQLLLLEDTTAPDPSRSHLHLYNFSDAPARLRAPNFNADLSPDAQPMNNVAAEVDPLTLDVAITLGNVDVAAFEGIDTGHGQSYSFLLTGALPKYAAIWTADKVKEK